MMRERHDKEAEQACSGGRGMLKESVNITQTDYHADGLSRRRIITQTDPLAAEDHPRIAGMKKDIERILATIE